MKKNLIISCLVLFSLSIVNGQIILKADKSNTNGYAVIEAVGLEVESPDCIHTNFGRHVTQTYDDILSRDVFEFHSHINEDNDRCEVFDRVRMEIKGGPGSSEIGQHDTLTTSYYRWKFKIASDFVGASSFCHLFQNKVKDGPDDDDPVITVTARSTFVELRHLGGNTGADLGTLVRADIKFFRGRWVEVFLKQKHGENGTIEAVFKDVVTGEEIMKYKNDKIDLWRTGASYSRPKWGVYRLKNAALKDEVVRFADICISETSEGQCPAENFIPNDNIPPSIPSNLIASQITKSSVKLTWKPSTDNIRVTGYKVFRDGVEIWKGADTTVSIASLAPGTSYSFAVSSFDFKLNESSKSAPIIVMTDDPNAPPSAATLVFPSNNIEGVSTNVRLSWTVGSNTDSSRVYIDTLPNPRLVRTVVGNSTVVDLLPNKTYYWQVGAKNNNAEVKTTINKFKTSLQVLDNGPWKVYRGNDRLEKEASFFTALELSPTPEIDKVFTDPNGSSNKYYGHHESGTEKMRWRSGFPNTDTAVTVVGRIRGISPDVSCITYYEIRAFGFREKLRLNKNTIKLERSEPIVEVPAPDDISNQFHVMRMTMKKNKTFIYIDEDPTPVAIGNSTTTDAGSNFEYGKSGTNECGGYIDWLAILNNREVAPGAGPALPSDLFLSSIADLTSITINGKPVANFDKNKLSYSVDVTNNNPIVNYELASKFSKVSVINFSASSQPYLLIKVIAQDGFTEKEYKVNYNVITNVKDIDARDMVSIYPNPVYSHFNVDLKYDNEGKMELYNVDGKLVKNQTLTNQNIIDMNLLPSGSYVVKIALPNKAQIFRSIIKQ